MTSPTSSATTATKKTSKLQITSNFTREPGGRYQSSVRNNNTGETKKIDSKKGKEVLSDVTFSRNPDTVTADGETLGWDDWAKSRGWESGRHGAGTTSTATATASSTTRDGEGEQQTGRQKIDPQVDPATVGFDASQL